jgi:hypothetical protein
MWDDVLIRNERSCLYGLFLLKGKAFFLLQNEFLLQTKKQRSLAIRMVGERWWL